MLVQRQTTTIRPMATAHLAQTMTLLNLGSGELSQKVENALASNPALDLAPERRCRTCRRVLPPQGPCPLCSRPESISGSEPIVFLSPPQDFWPHGGAFAGDLPEDNDPAESQNLPEYVLRQIATELAPADRPLAAHLLTNLDEDGLLAVSLAEVARYHHVPLPRLEALVRLIQHAEPFGVGSASPQEALLIQLEALSETRRVPPLAARAIREGMNLLSRHRYTELGALLGASAAQAKEIARFISDNLNPFPARAHWGDVRHGRDAHPAVYHNPDVIVSHLDADPGGPLVVEIVTPYAGRLRISPLFRQALKQAEPEANGQLEHDLAQAILLVKCLQQRNQALVRLMQELVVRQRAFLLHGEAHLHPLTRASLAKALDVHESTISRAVSSKSVQLPNGHIVPLAKFFDRSLQVRTVLKRIIAQEGHHLSDRELAKRLAGEGYHVARRTVAKYRAMEGILPVHLRESM
ncbi:MAG: RNA polymerase factor sigma-54 [Chloroflexota bacterium]